MVQDPFPEPGRDGEQPDRSAMPPAAGGTGPLPAGTGPEGVGHQPAGDRDGPAQGLFVCLPAEELTLAGFAQDGRADTMAPGPLLATVVDAVIGEDGSGLAGLGDDQLIGIISAARRIESRTAWALMAALGELARRRPAGTEPADIGTGGVSDFAADEVAAELHLTWQSAAAQIAYAATVAARLPRTFAALAAGKVHPVHVRIIEDETSVLSAADAARADAELAGKAAGMTFGRLRYAAHRLVLTLDPDAARRRKETAKREAQVCRFREDSGNAGMIARELPPDEVLASWQHVEQRALDLRAAGMPGTLQELRVRAYLDLLQERDSRAATDDQAPGQDTPPPGPGTNGPPAGPPGGDAGPGADSGPGDDGGPDGPGGAAGAAPPGGAGRGQARPVRAWRRW